MWITTVWATGAETIHIAEQPLHRFCRTPECPGSLPKQGLAELSRVDVAFISYY
jgi:hypothetical protein